MILLQSLSTKIGLCTNYTFEVPAEHLSDREFESCSRPVYQNYFQELNHFKYKGILLKHFPPILLCLVWRLAYLTPLASVSHSTLRWQGDYGDTIADPVAHDWLYGIAVYLGWEFDDSHTSGGFSVLFRKMEMECIKGQA